ncbi:acyltransferase family protein [Rhizobiales bacterium RZME27]|uniref:Acyltransferase family protein n=1 Tax=Endobacterium cereale TaxID=2663029 RepID=A0A6A8AKA9_9HYPH|nr:acyltransferase [Endobacterium cereale]MEB2847321.1 acyltransferase [Endobacterium cereale]MQY49171.1 acyltransferase family protein [Endobacterium cereale]
MRLNALTSLRFFAAFAVFVNHFNFWNTSQSPTIELISPVIRTGLVGVTFFFILSGFIISYSADRQISSGQYSPYTFMRNRIGRLFPVHILTLGVATYLYCYHLSFQTFSISRFTANISLMHSWVPDASYYFGYNGVSWSISNEIFFYTMFIFIIHISTRYVAITWLMLIGLIYFHATKIPPQSQDAEIWQFYINPAYRFVDFLTGIIIYKLYKRTDIKLTYRIATMLEISAIIIVASLTFIGLQFRINKILLWDLYYIIPMSIAVFVFAIGRGKISRMLLHPRLVLLGEASFSLYMSHQLLIFFADSTFSRYIDKDNALSLLFFAIPVVLFGIYLSVLIFKFYERPINNFIRTGRIEDFLRQSAGKLTVPLKSLTQQISIPTTDTAYAYKIAETSEKDIDGEFRSEKSSFGRNSRLPIGVQET